jgi:transposase
MSTDMPALPLTETGRLRLARCIVDDGWPVRRAAERFQVSRTTAAWWAARYRELGPAGMADRSSRPHRCPHQLPERTERRIIKLRVTGRLGPARIAWALHLNPSTVHQVLRRYHCPRLAHLDRAAKIPVRRYERDRPGEPIHVDVKKLSSIPDGGGWRVTGPSQGQKNRRATTSARKNNHPVLDYSYLHSALDDYSRLVYTEILPDERKDTATAFLRRAHAWYAQLGITIERILSGNGGCYRSLPRR